jgi:hypothetical protein
MRSRADYVTEKSMHELREHVIQLHLTLTDTSAQHV